MICARVAEYLKNNYHENAILSHLFRFLDLHELVCSLIGKETHAVGYHQEAKGK